METNRIVEAIRLHRMQAAALTLAAVMIIGSGGSLTPLSGSVTPASVAEGHQAAPLQIDDATMMKEAEQERADLLKNSVSIRFVTGTGTLIGSELIALADHPAWITLQRDMTHRMHADIDAHAIEQFLEDTPIDHLNKPNECTILHQYKDAQDVIRIETSCTAEGSYDYASGTVAALTKHALESGNSGITIPVTSVAPSIRGNDESGSLVHGTLMLLATGQSNFKGSGEGRKFNVRKALNEKINNIVIPEGATFSFVNALGGKVALSTGWQMALAIFNGKDLVPSPGGGICQASSTIYRAALRAGLPIIEHRSHSMFVHYYEAYGVGLDATIFPGQQDMTFVNDTPGPIVIQSYNRGDEAVVNIFGVNDDRSVQVSGPYFTATAPENLLIDGHTVRRNEIAWMRSVVMPNGDKRDEVFAARYTAIPKSLPKRSPATTMQTRGMMKIALHTMVAENVR